MALTEVQLQKCRFHGSLSQKGSWPLLQHNRMGSYRLAE